MRILIADRLILSLLCYSTYWIWIFEMLLILEKTKGNVCFTHARMNRIDKTKQAFNIPFPWKLIPQPIISLPYPTAEIGKSYSYRLAVDLFTSDVFILN